MHEFGPNSINSIAADWGREVWAGNADATGPSQDTFYFKGPLLFSHGEPIARFVDTVNGRVTALITCENFVDDLRRSHMAALWRAVLKRVDEYEPKFLVPCLGNAAGVSEIDHVINLEYLFRRHCRLNAHAQRVLREGEPMYKYVLKAEKSARSYARSFGLMERARQISPVFFNRKEKRK